MKNVFLIQQIETIYNLFYELSLNEEENEFKELLQKHRFSRTKGVTRFSSYKI